MTSGVKGVGGSWINLKLASFLSSILLCIFAVAGLGKKKKKRGDQQSGLVFLAFLTRILPNRSLDLLGFLAPDNHPISPLHASLYPVSLHLRVTVKFSESSGCAPTSAWYLLL